MSQEKRLSIRIWFEVLRQLFRVARPRGIYIGGAVLSVALSSLFQLVGLGLVIPVLNGLAESKRFDGLQYHLVLGPLLRALPFGESDWGIFLLLMGLIFIAVLFENLFMYFGQVLSARVAMDSVFRIREQAFARTLGFSKGFFDKHRTGELSSYFTNLPSLFGQLIEQLLRLLVLVSFSTTFFVLMIAISIELTLAVAVLLPLTHFIAKSIGRRIEVSARGEVEQTIRFTDRVVDVLSNMSLVHMSGAEELELHRVRSIASEMRRFGFNARKKRYLAPRVVDIINSAGVLGIVVLAVSIYFATGTEFPGRFFVYFLSLRRLTSHLEQLTSVYVVCNDMFVSVEKLLWIFLDDGKEENSSGEKPFPGLKDEIAFEGVSFGYAPERKVLNELSFRVRRSEIVALVGATGAGKTTLVNLIPRFYDPSEGRITIDGVDLREFQLPQLRERISVVSQDALILNDSIRANLLYGLKREPSDTELRSALEMAHLWDFLERQPEKLETHVGTKGVRLSGGEKQRLSIARAILRNPEILILDEATSALDSETELKIQLALEELFRGRTVFVIAHRLSTIAKSNLVLVLDGGKILERGTPSELLEKGGAFSRYWELQKGAMS